MLILKENASFEYTVKNSRFLSELIRIDSPEEARKIWHEQKLKYGMNHLVYAFISGASGEIMGCSDDGEPSGTAGRPTLEVLKGSSLTYVLLTTARWFGGTLLGTGGLVRAYTMGAQGVLEAAQTRELVPVREVSLKIPYPLYEPVRLVLRELSAESVTEEFGPGVSLHAVIRERDFPFLKKRLEDLSSGGIRPE